MPIVMTDEVPVSVRHFGGLLKSPFDRFICALFCFWCFDFQFSLKSLTVVFLQRFYMVKPCPKELKCDVEVDF